MKERFLQLASLVDALNLRERGLVFMSGTAVIFVTWNLLLFSPQNAVRQSLNLQMRAMQQKLSVRAQEATVLAGMVGVNVDEKKLQELSELKLESSMLKEEMSEHSLKLIPADKLLDVLRDVLEQSNELSIDRIEFLPPERLQPDRRSSESNGQDIYKHTVELTLEGDYFDLVQYLQGLEDLPWRLYWDSLNYRVSSYPLGDIELKVSTLSMSGALFESQTP